VGRIALYRDETRPLPRAEVLLEPRQLTLMMPTGETRSLELDGSATITADAASHRRFVRMLIVESRGARLVAITPPDRGTIAPRAIRLPEAPADAAVIENPAYDTLADWLLGGGRLAGCTVGELARLAQIASASFAALIGEVAAQVAVDMVWESSGPWRGCVDLEHALRPLHDASRTSVRAAEALVAALSVAAVLQPRRQRRAG
jgi:hypothetical protein